MINLKQEWTNLKSEKNQLIMPFIVGLIILFCILFGSENSRGAEEVTFEPKLPEQELVIPWKVKRAEFKGSLEQNEKVNYLYSISNSKDFVLTVLAENGTLDHMRRSIKIGKNGYYDKGLCQVNQQWHSAFINSPDFKDWRKQARYCLEVFKKRPTAFYGYYVRGKMNRVITFN